LPSFDACALFSVLTVLFFCPPGTTPLSSFDVSPFCFEFFCRSPVLPLLRTTRRFFFPVMIYPAPFRSSLPVLRERFTFLFPRGIRLLFFFLLFQRHFFGFDVFARPSSLLCSHFFCHPLTKYFSRPSFPHDLLGAGFFPLI